MRRLSCMSLAASASKSHKYLVWVRLTMSSRNMMLVLGLFLSVSVACAYAATVAPITNLALTQSVSSSQFTLSMTWSGGAAPYGVLLYHGSSSNCASDSYAGSTTVPILQNSYLLNVTYTMASLLNQYFCFKVIEYNNTNITSDYSPTVYVSAPVSTTTITTSSTTTVAPTLVGCYNADSYETCWNWLCSGTNPRCGTGTFVTCSCASGTVSGCQVDSVQTHCSVTATTTLQTTTTIASTTTIPARSPTPPCGSYGDLNNDGVVNATDISLVSDCIMGQSDCTSQMRARADVNNDGEIGRAHV